jgi:hypothetical protein
VENREGGGAEFRFQLPVEGQPPALDTHEPVLENPRFSDIPERGPEPTY